MTCPKCGSTCLNGITCACTRFLRNLAPTWFRRRSRPLVLRPCWLRALPRLSKLEVDLNNVCDSRRNRERWLTLSGLNLLQLRCLVLIRRWSRTCFRALALTWCNRLCTCPTAALTLPNVMCVLPIRRLTWLWKTDALLVRPIRLLSNLVEIPITLVFVLGVGVLGPIITGVVAGMSTGVIIGVIIVVIIGVGGLVRRPKPPTVLTN